MVDLLNFLICLCYITYRRWIFYYKQPRIQINLAPFCAASLCFNSQSISTCSCISWHDACKYDQKFYKLILNEYDSCFMYYMFLDLHKYVHDWHVNCAFVQQNENTVCIVIKSSSFKCYQLPWLYVYSM